MVLITEGLSATRILSLTAYSATLAVCLAKRRIERADSRWRRFYAGLALCQLVLLLDIAFNWRWKLHDFFMHVAMAQKLYGERRLPQRLGLVLLALLAMSVAGWLLWKLRMRVGAAVACAATVVAFALDGVEMISYHGMDAVLYRMVGGVKAVSLLWVVLAALICAGVWKDWRR